MAEDLRDKLGAQHLPLRDQVLAALRTAIIDGDYLPGERLTEDRLAEDFGVSRNPVREALRVAEAEGFVVILPRRGAVVASPSSGTIADMFAVRERLETLAARLAAERATAADVASLRALLDQGREATQRQDLARVAELNSTLHLRILADQRKPLAVVDRQVALPPCPVGLPARGGRTRAALVGRAHPTRRRHRVRRR